MDTLRNNLIRVSTSNTNLLLLDLAEKKIAYALPQQPEDSIIYIVEDSLIAMLKDTGKKEFQDNFLFILAQIYCDRSLKDNQIDKAASFKSKPSPPLIHPAVTEPIFARFTKKLKSALEFIKFISYTHLQSIITTVRIR